MEILDALDPVPTWREMRDLEQAALDQIAAGKAHRAYSAIEIEGFRAERDRLDALIATFLAARDYEAQQDD